MSAKAKKRTVWAVVLLILALLIFLDFSITSAEKQKGDMSTILRNLLYGGSTKSNTIVGVCNSMDPGLNTLQAAVDAEVTYAQVDSITRMSVTRAGGLQNVVEPGDWVVIKPNFLVVPGVTSGTFTWAHNGVTTDLRVIKSVIQQLIEEGDAARITIAEGATWRKNGDPQAPGQTVDGWTYHWPWFGNLSVEDMIAEFNTTHPGITFDYIDLNYPPYTLTPVPGGGLSQDSYYIPDAILQCDKLIAVAAMKTHNLTRVTLTNKLYVGTSPASVYAGGKFDHNGIPHYTQNGVPNAIERTLVDLMSYHPPDFGIVECFWGTEGNGPLGGSAIQRNLVIAGRDPVAVDAISTYTMGMNPWDIDHLHWSSAKGFGTNDMRYINTVGPDLNDIRHNFARAKAQGRANRVWLINGTHAGTDLDVDMLDGQETAIDPIEGQTTNGKTWTAFTDIDDYMNLAKEYAFPSSCISYAFTRIYSDASKSVRLRFGADDGIKIWLNGSTVYTSSSTESYSLLAHDLPITLQPGENRLLVKVRNTSGSYGFSVCVSESGGDTPLGITYDIQSPGAPQITLNTPVEGATVTDSFVTLSASVSDPDGDSVTVRFYGDTASAASELLYATKVGSGTTVDYTWKTRTLEPTTGTFGLWHFDENGGTVLHDATGRGHDGSWHCPTTETQMWTNAGAFGYGLDFFGYHTGTPENPCGADYVEVPDDPDLDVDPAGQLTMELWIKPDCLPPMTGYTCDTARYWGIVTKRIPCVPPQDTVSGCGSAANYCIFYNYPTQTIGFYGNTNLYVSTCSLTVGQWQYIAVTVDGATGDLRFYKNGVLKQARTGYIGALVDGPLRIGASAYRRKGVDGKIDEVRLSRRILGPQEIAENYKLATGTYYWRVAATDGVETTNSLTRSFGVTALGPGDPPEITLNSPANGANTTNNYMHLNATVTDASPTKVWFYGGTTADPTDLLYARENVTGTQTFDHNWNLQRFDPESGHTMGLWHFDEGSGTAVGDESGNGNTGGFSGSPAWSTDGRFGYALDFDGTDDYITIPDAASLDADSAGGAITIEAWLYPHASGGSRYRSLIAKRGLDPNGTLINYQISLNNTNGNLLFYNGHRIDVSSVYVPLNQWSYIAVTLSATEGRLRFYLNGTLSDSIATATFGGEYTTPLTIGTAARVGECYDGLMDEVRLTNRALSPAEIAANYTGGLVTGTYYWKVAADDGAKTLSESEVRNFYVGPGGADDDPPVITLTAPDDAATTSNEYMTLSATISDQSNTTVWVYGDTTSNPAELLYVKENIIGNQNIDYAWNASRLTRQSPNTMGLWHIDDGIGTSLADASGNGNGGTFVSAPAWSSSGKFGYALDFDGSNDYVTIPDAGSLDIDSANGEITMEAWIYPHTSGNNIWRSFISKKAMNGGGAVNYQISLDRLTGNLLFYSGHWPQIWISSVSIPLNQWSYVAVTLKGTEGRLRFYRNGVLLDSTVTYSGNGGCFGAANSTVLTIGTAGLIGECYDGMIDEVRLTKRALSSSEIAANYKLGDGVYHWKVTATDALANSATAGPRQFTVRTKTSPQFTNCPVSPININHCDTAHYDCDAFDPDGDSLRFAITGVTGTGIALIDSGSGLLTYIPGIPLDINRTATVTVEVVEVGGVNNAVCDIAFNVTNRPPFISCGQTPVYTLSGRPVTKSDIMAGDNDRCDLMTLLLVGGPGSWEAGTSTYHWVPEVSDTGLHHVTVDASDGYVYSECAFDVNVYGQPYDLQIDRKSEILQGHFVSLDIVETKGSQPLGGYDLLIAYDAATATLVSAATGDLFDECGWEYFSYRSVPYSECGTECPTGLVNLVAQADINDGSHHPDCNTTPLPASLATLTFKVASDLSLKCRHLPVYFFWREFKDNRLWSIANDSIYMSRRVFDNTGQNGSEIWTDITDYTYGLPGRYGVPTTPVLDSSETEDPGFFRYVDFRNGGIDITCGDSTSLRGDINANGIRNEIADAVMFVNFFLVGVAAFDNHVDASIAASDVNNDGSTLSVGDLVLLIRIINGDATPFTKSSTKGQITIFPEITDTMITVVYGATSEARAALLTFHGDGVIESLRTGNGASSMSIGYGRKDGELRLLIYDFGTHAIDKGADTLCIVSLHGTLELVEADVADYDGSTMEVSIHPPRADVLLQQNRPNPFNPVTAIEYYVPSQSHVTIIVLNLLGQHVTTLVDEDKSPGTYRVIWDGADQIGKPVATGVYLYRLRVDNHVETKKMLLIK